MNQVYTNYQFLDRFVDRDMFMRFLGIGIGHCGQHTPNGDEQMDGFIDEDNEVQASLDSMVGDGANFRSTIEDDDEDDETQLNDEDSEDDGDGFDNVDPDDDDLGYENL